MLTSLLFVALAGRSDLAVHTIGTQGVYGTAVGKGDLDILITNLGSRVQLLENRTTDAGHWITVKLAPNALAWGSKVLATVDVDGPGPLAPVTKRRDVIAGRSYLSGTPAEVHFGLGRADTASIRVIWVDGTETDLGIVPANTAIVAEPL